MTKEKRVNWKMLDYAEKIRMQMYDVFQATIHDMLFGRKYKISYTTDYQEFWIAIYDDFSFPKYAYRVIFPVDILYIKALQNSGPTVFLDYIWKKLAKASF